jgi:hypothetical protein
MLVHFAWPFSSASSTQRNVSCAARHDKPCRFLLMVPMQSAGCSFEQWHSIRVTAVSLGRQDRMLQNFVRLGFWIIDALRGDRILNLASAKRVSQCSLMDVYVTRRQNAARF